MTRPLGGYIGHSPTTTTLVAPGVWTLREAEGRRRALAWPTSGDPFFANVVLLLSMDGANGSTTFTDSSATPQTVTANGGAQISTAESRFGGSSLATANNRFLSWTHSGALNFASGQDFTVEAWVFTPGTSAYSTLIDARTAAQFGFFACGVMHSSGTHKADFVDQNSSRLTTSQSVPLNEWFHVAWVRSGSTLRCYINGVQDSVTITMAGERTAVQSTARIGGNYDPGFFDGYIDELRITKGVARYMAGFTPPTAPFPGA
jgi:hypothetical protein